MIFLDTTFLVDLLRKEQSAIDWLSQIEEVAIFTSEINVFELYTGLFRSTIKKSKLKQRTFELERLISSIEILPFNRESSIESAKLLADVLKKGTPVGTRDIMIAGTAQAHGINRILTRNIKHFKIIKGIVVISY